jgi:hypothetical protein
VRWDSIGDVYRHCQGIEPSLVKVGSPMVTETLFSGTKR